MAVHFKDIFDAAHILSGQINRTPCIYSQSLSEITGSQIILKLENLQYTGSFKERGALVKLLSLNRKQRSQGVIAMSAGNHAQAVAYHGSRLGIPVVIIMPRTTPSIKVSKTKALGAEVILHGQELDESEAFTRDLAKKRNLNFVHPYDDAKIIAGQGTVAVEMLESFKDIEVLLIPVGGGGLIAGNAISSKEINPSIEVIGVETEVFPSMYQTINRLPVKCEHYTIAEGIAVKNPGVQTKKIIKKLVDDILIVDEKYIEKAVLNLLEDEKTVAEGAGAAGLAAVLKYRDRFKGRKAGLIISGGNLDPFTLSSIIQRGLVRSGRLVRLKIEVKDIPGTLADITTRISKAEANILEISHQRRFTHLPIQTVEVELVLRTRGIDHLNEVIHALESEGYKTQFNIEDIDQVY